MTTHIVSGSVSKDLARSVAKVRSIFSFSRAEETNVLLFVTDSRYEPTERSHVDVFRRRNSSQSESECERKECLCDTADLSIS